MSAVARTFAKKSRRGLRPKNASSSFTGSAQSLIAAPGAGISIVIDAITINVDTDDQALTVYHTSDESGNRLIYNKFKAGGGVVREYLEGYAIPANTALLGSMASGNAYYVIDYHLETVN